MIDTFSIVDHNRNGRAEMKLANGVVVGRLFVEGDSVVAGACIRDEQTQEVHKITDANAPVRILPG
jgi:hypothetical protein